ncbi:hypothetical protein GCM10023189_31850 [Nibrella saemangeumensis]|uniref:Methyltransferase FkbM domain-containing protein n=1 Tax=Nibrella saemangeumensis TaxID=1084526 RepID=A0ABP8N2R5_9BACT
MLESLFYKKIEYIKKPIQIFKRLYWPFLKDTTNIKCHLPWGLSLLVDPNQTIGKAIYTLGVYDLILTETIHRIISTGDNVFDVGANIGYITNLMAYKCGANGKVYSYEPHPYLVDEYLLKNIQLLRDAGYSNVEFFPYALSDVDGEGILNIPSGFENNNGIATLEHKGEAVRCTIPVILRKLDSLISLDKSFKLLKIDVEGHEYSVFKGAKTLLTSGVIKNVIYEEHLGINSKASQYLKSLGYTIYKLNRSKYGVAICNPDDSRLDISYEVVNYLATKEPEFIQDAFSNKGWNIYK